MSLLLFFKPQFRILRAEIPQPYSRARLAESRMKWRRQKHEERIRQMKKLVAATRAKVAKERRRREMDDVLLIEALGLL